MLDAAHTRGGRPSSPDGEVPDGTVSQGFFAEVRRRSPDQVLEVLREHLGGQVPDAEVDVWLVDIQQRTLLPFTPRPTVPGRAPVLGAGTDTLSLTGSLAGRAYQDGARVSAEEDGVTVSWLPLRRGAERLGVARVSTPRPLSEDEVQGLGELLDCFSHAVLASVGVSDAVALTRHTADLELAAEIQWSLLPPLTWSDARVTVSAVLEPAYDVAGDFVDYNVDGRGLHLAVFDGMGHGLDAARLSAFTTAAYRNARRRGLDLVELTRRLDQTLQDVVIGEGFATAVLAYLDLERGELEWACSGHPDPLLFREGQLVGALTSEHHWPLGVGGDGADAGPVDVGRQQLQPGDAVVLYTDGVVEARNDDGEEFGLPRFVELIAAHLLSGLPAPESMRRVATHLLDHRGSLLDDDASVLAVQWHG